MKIANAKRFVALGALGALGLLNIPRYMRMTQKISKDHNVNHVVEMHDCEDGDFSPHRQVYAVGDLTEVSIFEALDHHLLVIYL